MKRLLFIALLSVLMIVPFTTVNAINLDVSSPHILAEMMPGSTEIFAATRIGDDFIAELDAITVALYDKLPDSLGIDEPYTIDRTLGQAFEEEGRDWNELKALLGDYAAIGLEPVNGFNSGEDPNTVLIIEITDQAGAEAYFLSLVEDDAELPERQTEGDTIIYLSEDDNQKMMITPEHLFFTNNTDYTPNVDPPLSTSADFTGALSMLGAEQYNMLAYVSKPAVEAMLSEGDMDDLQQMGFNPDDAGAIAIGLTILDGSTFTIDVAIKTASPMPTSTVSLDFLNALPGTTDAFIVSTDLTNVYNSTIAAVQAAAEANGEEDPTVQVPVMFGMTGLDLEEDVLSWTTGSYGIFLGADFLALIEEAMNTGTIAELDFDAGIVIEATDVALAQNAASELGEFITAMTASQEDVTVTQEDINGTAVTSIMLQGDMGPGMPPLELQLVLTATDDFFFFGTRSAFDTITSGNTLASNPDFEKAKQYFLENPSSVWYMNSDGVVVSTMVPLALVGPAIENVFNEIIDELGTSNGTDSESSTTADDFALILEGLQVYDDILSSLTITSSVDVDGIVRIRATMSVNP